MARMNRVQIKKAPGKETMIAYGRSDRGMRVVVGAAAYVTLGLTKPEVLALRAVELEKILKKET